MSKIVEAAKKHPFRTTAALAFAGVAIHGLLGGVTSETSGDAHDPKNFGCVTEINRNGDGKLVISTRAVGAIATGDKVDYRLILRGGGPRVGDAPAEQDGTTLIEVGTSKDVSAAEVSIRSAGGMPTPCRVSILDAVRADGG